MLDRRARTHPWPRGGVPVPLTDSQRALLADIASQVELAQALGVSRSLVTMWIKRYDDFPLPVLVLATGRYYRLSEVLRWHEERRRPVTPRRSGR